MKGLVTTIFLILLHISPGFCQAKCDVSRVDESFCVKNIFAYHAIRQAGKLYSYDYTSLTGPLYWQCMSRKCGGKRQSPININTVSVKREIYPTPLTINGLESYITKVTYSNGMAVTAKFEFDGPTPTLEGGPLKRPFTFIENRLHFGVTDRTGSEHRIDGKSYALESQFLFANLDKYGNLTECFANPDGFAVVAMLYQVDEAAPDHHFFNMIDKIKLYQTSFSFDVFGIGLTKFGCYLGPHKFLYAYYKGSWTRPPCQEAIQWFVSLDVQKINPTQMKLFRELRSANDTVQAGNWRLPQPIGTRSISVGFFEGPGY